MKKWLNGAEVDMSFEQEGKQKKRMEESFPKEFLIEEYKQKLLETDYIICKIVEGEATLEDYKDIIKLRKEWRREIRKLEKEIKK